MQTPTEKPATLDLLAAAERAITESAAYALHSLRAAEAEVARFESLCDVLLEHGLEFKPEVYVSTDSGAIYHFVWMDAAQSEKHAADMLLTLAALGCEESHARHCGITGRTSRTIIGEHSPKFTLFIEDKQKPATRAGSAGGGHGWESVKNGVAA